MDLASYADLAARLVNTADRGQGQGDRLGTVESYRCLVADRPQLAAGVTPTDLEALRLLRDELWLVFRAASRRHGAAAAGLLNALLARHPIHQQVTSHDGQHWHVHLVESGSAADKYAAAAIAGITCVIGDSGMGGLGVCAASGCQRAFLDTSQSGGNRYCSDRCTPKASVRSLRERGQVRSQRPASTTAAS